MANYEKIIERYPEVADFVRERLSIRYRGEIMAYRRNIRCDSFSTDEAGFRHSTLGGKTYSVAECVASERYGLILGASHNFGFGIAGNENTMASLLAERFGFPFAIAAMPGANSRNLHSLLVGFLATGPRPPAIVLLSTGGDLAGFCASGLADPVFGSPNRGLLKSVLKDAPLPTDPEARFSRIFAFTALWTSAIGSLCNAYNIPLALLGQSTFFEKSKAGETESAAELGKPFSDAQARLFTNHRTFNRPYGLKRKAMADRRGIPLTGWGMIDELSFIDEFHCDRDSIRLLSDEAGDIVETLLSAPARSTGARRLESALDEPSQGA